MFPPHTNDDRPIALDVADPASPEQAIGEALEQVGRLDVLDNNAGTDKSFPIDELCLYHIKVTAVIAGGMQTPFLLDCFPDIDINTLQNPANVAQAIRSVLLMPEGSVIADITVLPLQESSWP